MTMRLKGSLRRMSAVLAAFAVAFTISGLTLAGTASAAPSAPADEVGVTAGVSCSKGTGSSTEGNEVIRYAWAKCSDDFGGQFYRFRLLWSCSGESWERTTTWYRADGRTIVGACPAGKFVDSTRVITDYDA
ncbi:hypothetical protein [Glycomyces rhizosphaerae]|uniref:Uncharacterized protein n=1 Tax=Glycomyces rhizosphaerae TaxID=2054422 RepID=A0ABV7PXL5_9ACTN